VSRIKDLPEDSKWKRVSLRKNHFLKMNKFANINESNHELHEQNFDDHLQASITELNMVKLGAVGPRQMITDRIHKRASMKIEEKRCRTPKETKPMSTSAMMHKNADFVTNGNMNYIKAKDTFAKRRVSSGQSGKRAESSKNNSKNNATGLAVSKRVQRARKMHMGFAWANTNELYSIPEQKLGFNMTAPIGEKSDLMMSVGIDLKAQNESETSVLKQSVARHQANDYLTEDGFPYTDPVKLIIKRSQECCLTRKFLNTLKNNFVFESTNFKYNIEDPKFFFISNPRSRAFNNNKNSNVGGQFNYVSNKFKSIAKNNDANVPRLIGKN
jgi:hypothetical protein